MIALVTAAEVAGVLPQKELKVVFSDEYINPILELKEFQMLPV